MLKHPTNPTCNVLGAFRRTAAGTCLLWSTVEYCFGVNMIRDHVQSSFVHMHRSFHPLRKSRKRCPGLPDYDDDVWIYC
eukprot:3780869-Rhodomonas_salina.1